ncbi:MULTISPECIES: sensor histidine kinase [unclassified Streptomyces]|uniref:sensor histidine kinase n=1 Tax=unclassified Streptomyces TaxID=2593676 RepID=UPI0022592563|nr:ATP-binding protein [Streptomyces sp. NBC_01551]MCX4529642.1 hypothetical protein [Streptomyces sp. NBC_01551]
MQLSAHPAAVRIRAGLPVTGEVVYAVGSLWISSTMVRNWPDPQGYWRDTDALAYALLVASYLPLALRRRFPVAILASTAFCVAAYFTLGYYHVVAVCGLLLPLYTVASLIPRRVSARCAAGALLVLLWGTRLAEPGIGPLSAREALAEMRRMLVLLRAREAAPADPALPGVPRLAQLDEPAKRVGEAGVGVDVQVTGAAYPLPSGIDLCAYRVVQEALTNVLKHAPAARTTVRVHYAEDEVRVRVKDDGKGHAGARDSVPRGAPGQGLIGMRERATIYHGTVSAEPAPEGGFEVRLRIPVPRAGRGA